MQLRLSTEDFIIVALDKYLTSKATHESPSSLDGYESPSSLDGHDRFSFSPGRLTEENCREILMFP